MPWPKLHWKGVEKSIQADKNMNGKGKMLAN